MKLDQLANIAIVRNHLQMLLGNPNTVKVDIKRAVNQKVLELDKLFVDGVLELDLEFKEAQKLAIQDKNFITVPNVTLETRTLNTKPTKKTAKKVSKKTTAKKASKKTPKEETKELSEGEKLIAERLAAAKQNMKKDVE